MKLIQLTIAAILTLGGLAQTDPEEPMAPPGTPIEGGCLAKLIGDVTAQSDDPKTPMIIVRRRGSSRRFPDPNAAQISSPEGKALYSNETTEFFESMNLTRVELNLTVRNELINVWKLTQGVVTSMPSVDTLATGNGIKTFDRENMPWSLDCTFSTALSLIFDLLS